MSRTTSGSGALSHMATPRQAVSRCHWEGAHFYTQNIYNRYNLNKGGEQISTPLPFSETNPTPPRGQALKARAPLHRTYWSHAIIRGGPKSPCTRPYFLRARAERPRSDALRISKLKAALRSKHSTNKRLRKRCSDFIPKRIYWLLSIGFIGYKGSLHAQTQTFSQYHNHHCTALLHRMRPYPPPSHCPMPSRLSYGPGTCKRDE